MNAVTRARGLDRDGADWRFGHTYHPLFRPSCLRGPSAAQGGPDPEIDGHEDTKSDETDGSHTAPICFVSFVLSWLNIGSGGRTNV